MKQPGLVIDPDITAFDRHLDRTFEQFLLLTWYLAHPDLTDWPPQY